MPTPFERANALIVKCTASAEHRLRLLEVLPTPQDGQYIEPLVALIRESIVKLRAQQATAPTVRSKAARLTYVEKVLPVLEEISNQISAFDEALKRTKWGAEQLKLIKQEGWKQ